MIHITTRLPLANFYLIFIVFFIVWAENHTFTLQHTVLGFLVDLERRSMIPSELCIRTPVFLPYYIYAFYSDCCYALPCHVCVVSLVRFRVNKVLMD